MSGLPPATTSISTGFEVKKTKSKEQARRGRHRASMETDGTASLVARFVKVQSNLRTKWAYTCQRQGYAHVVGNIVLRQTRRIHSEGVLDYGFIKGLCVLRRQWRRVRGVRVERFRCGQ